MNCRYRGVKHVAPYRPQLKPAGADLLDNRLRVHVDSLNVRFTDLRTAAVRLADTINSTSLCESIRMRQPCKCVTAAQASTAVRQRRHGRYWQGYRTRVRSTGRAMSLHGRTRDLHSLSQRVTSCAHLAEKCLNHFNHPVYVCGSTERRSPYRELSRYSEPINLKGGPRRSAPKQHARIVLMGLPKYAALPSTSHCDRPKYKLSPKAPVRKRDS